MSKVGNFMSYEMNWTQEYYKIIQEEYHIESDDTVIKVSFENIVDVTEKELIFKNNEGKMQTISLEECVKNFYTAFGVPEEEYTTKKWRRIGGRYSANPISFYEIFTANHHIRFCMTYKITRFKSFLDKIGLNGYSKDYSEFRSLERKLNAIGFSTMDLT